MPTEVTGRRISRRDGDGTVQRPGDSGIIETEIAGIPGVVAVDNRLHAREHEPTAPRLRHS